MKVVYDLAGRVTHHFSHLFYRLDRRDVKKSGRAYFTCSVPKCKARFVVYGRILDLDRGSMSSVVSRLSGRGQVSFMELSIW